MLRSLYIRLLSPRTDSLQFRWILLAVVLPLAVSALSAQGVTLQWDPNSESDLAGYNVYRSTQSGWGYVKVNSALLPTTNYTDNTLNPGTTYYYVCTAVNNAGLESGYSNQVSAALPSANRNPVANPDAVTTARNTGIQIAVLANDSDPDGDPLTLASVGTAANGSVSKSGNIAVYYPATNFVGVDTFTYSVADGRGGSATGTVTVTVVQINSSPVAVNDSATTAEDNSVTINVVANDTDADGDLLTITAVGQPQRGTAVKVSASSVQYTPNPDYHGADSFTYTISDGKGGTATGTVSITVTPVNDPPVAVDDAATVAEDSSVTIQVLANDTDVDGDSLSLASVGMPQHGTAARTPANRVLYTPKKNYWGSDSFTYTVSDGKGGTAVGTVTVTVTPVNDAPVAVNDSATVARNSTVIIDVVANDTDVEGDTLTVTTVGAPKKGTATKVSGTSVQYTPNKDYVGTDSFSYTISDGNGGTATGTVSITVTNTNNPPVAANDSATVAEDGSVTVNVLANDTDPDNDPLSISAVGQPQFGTAAQASSTSILYTPNRDFHGSDSFTYTIGDGKGGTATATVVITVTPVNDPPVAVNDTATVVEDGSVTINVTANDTDVDGDSLSVSAVGQPQNGTAVIVSATSIRYTPRPDFHGNDTFIYTVGDGKGGTATGTVTVIVTPVNDPPVAVDDSASTTKGHPISIAVLANDRDPDGDPLTVTSVSQPANGSAVLSGTQLVVYTPSANFIGVDTFTYTISDGNGGTANGRVSVTVDETNNSPIANDDVAVTLEDHPVEINVLANDSDPDGDSLVVQQVSQGRHGQVDIIRGNRVRYTPNPDFHGADSFTYVAADPSGNTDSAVVQVTVTPVNDSPAATDDTAVVAEDGSVTINVVANDTDGDGDTLTVTSVGRPQHGSAVIVSTGSVRYSPDPDYFGPDSFEYTISDGQGGSATASVMVTVTPVNDPPVAVNDSATVDEDGSVTINVVANDTDVEGDALFVATVGQSSNGVAEKVSATSIQYTPLRDFHGTDSFTYTVSDGNGGTAIGTVTVTVAPVNDAPVANDDKAETLTGQSIKINVLINDTDVDGDTLSVTFVGQPAYGTAAQADGGWITYTPPADFLGWDEFSYGITDGQGGTASALVKIRMVEEENLPPTALDDEVVTDEDTSVDIRPLLNDTDPAQDQLEIESFTQPPNGRVTFIYPATLRYLPSQDFHGQDSFRYVVHDGRDARATATVRIRIRPVNDPPRPNRDYPTTTRNTAVEIDVVENDEDVDGDDLVVTSVGKSRQGTVTLLPNGNIHYSPKPGFTGVDTFSYMVSDGIAAPVGSEVDVSVVEPVKRVKKMAFPSTLQTGSDLLRNTFVGVGLLNMEAESAQIDVSSRNELGAEVDNRELPEPLRPFGQTAFLTTEVLNNTFASTVLETKSSNDALRGFFMAGDFTGRRLDGVGALPAAGRELYFTGVREGDEESTVLHLVNPNPLQNARITLELRSKSGVLLDHVKAVLPAAGSFVGTAREVFGIQAGSTEGYIKIIADSAVQGYEILANRQAIAAGAAREAVKVQRLVAPQFFVDSTGGTSTLRVLNPRQTEVQAVARIRDDYGNVVTSRSLGLAANTLTVVDANELLGRLRTLISGSFELEVSGDETADLIATLTFAGGAGRSMTTVPVLNEAGYRDTVFSQVAQTKDGSIFTGLAIYNPSTTATDVVVEAFDESGNLTAATTFELGSYQRRIDLLASDAFFGTAFEQLKGHLRVRSAVGVASYAIFGDLAGNFLSSIEGQPAVD